MAKEDVLVMNGIVLENLPNSMFRIRLENNHILLGILSGKMKINNIRIIPGDKVRLEVSPYDLSKGRITYREK